MEPPTKKRGKPFVSVTRDKIVEDFKKPGFCQFHTAKEYGVSPSKMVSEEKMSPLEVWKRCANVANRVAHFQMIPLKLSES